jgi:hypothetical protein
MAAKPAETPNDRCLSAVHPNQNKKRTPPGQAGPNYVNKGKFEQMDDYHTTHSFVNTPPQPGDDADLFKHNSVTYPEAPGSKASGTSQEAAAKIAPRHSAAQDRAAGVHGRRPRRANR